MRLNSSSARIAVRATLLTSFALLAAASFAQFNMRSMPPVAFTTNEVHEQTVVREIPLGVEFSTRDFFPQIHYPVGQKGVRPEHPRPFFYEGNAIENSLTPGRMTGTSTAVTSAKFAGIDFTGSVPPDPHMAVGPGHIVQVVNNSIAFFKKSDGEPLFAQTYNSFFSGLGAPNFTSDPRVIYDQFNERWLLMILALDFGSEVSEFLVAVSDDSDPMGTWTKYRIDNVTQIGNTDFWVDYPNVGYNEDSISLSGNLFGFSGGLGGTQVFVIPSADLYDNTGSANMVGFTLPGIVTVQFADSYTDQTGFIFGVARTGATAATVYALGDLTGTPTLTSTTVSIPQNIFIGSAPSGNTGLIDSLSHRMMDATYRGGSLVAAHTIASSSGIKGVVRWYEFLLGDWPNSGSPTLAQSGDIELPGDQWSLMPSVSMNSLGDISVIYTRSSSSIFSDLVISSRKIGDPAGAIGAPTLLASGLSSASPNMGGRWGDYYSAVVDPDDDATFWGNGETVTANGLWTTEISSWVVTPGGPGGGGGILYEALAASTHHGNYFAGSFLDLAASDNGFFDIDSEFLPGQGHYGSLQADFMINEPAADVDKLTFSIESMVEPGRGATGMVFLYNWNKGDFEYQKAFRIRPQGNIVKAFTVDTDPDDFVSSSGQVRMIVRAHDPFRRTGPTPEPFRLRTDFVRLAVFPIN